MNPIKYRDRIMNEFLNLGAFEISKLIRDKAVSIPEVVSFFIEQQQKFQPFINAVVEDRYQKALIDADEKQKILKTNLNLPPLFGVPYTMKEMFAVKGMKSTNGSLAQKNNIMSYDSTAVKRLNAAGGILLSTTNVPEAGLWFETFNLIYGTTNNPHDLTRTCGGSSGGEAAVIASGGAPFGVGSDIGGSIRIPSAFCGIFGHKPSDFTVPLTGHTPIYPNEAHKHSGLSYPLTVAGPMAKRAGDLRPLLDILKGPDGVDPNTIQKEFGAPITSWKGKKVFVLPDPSIFLSGSSDKIMIDATLAAADFFKSEGAEIIELPKNIFKKAVSFWSARCEQMESRDLQTTFNPSGKVTYSKEFAKWAIGKESYTFPLLVAGLIDRTFKNSTQIKNTNEKLRTELSELKSNLNQMLAQENILILPPHPRPAPKHRTPYFRPFDFAYTGIFNALGNPTSAGPVLWKNNLPAAIQVVAATNFDHVCISAIEAIERSFGGWRLPALND
jgi:fatty acid amide hydrolase 2